jgi:hypothetical protein
VRNDEELNQKYSTLLEDFNKNKNIKFYYPAFFLLRILFIFNLYYISSYPLLQVVVCASMPIFNIIIVKTLNIYKKASTERLFILNEIVVLIVFVLIGLFLMELEDSKEEIIAHAVIGVVIFGFFIGILASLIKIINSIRYKCKRNQVVKKEDKTNDFNPKVILKCGDKSPESHGFHDSRSFIQVVPFNSNYPSAFQSFNLDP